VKKNNKNKCNNAFKALVLNVITNNNFKEQDFNCFFTIFGTLFISETAFVSTELANKACAHLLTAFIDATDTATKTYAHLLITPTNATDLFIKADLFVYNITVKSCYNFTVFIGIIVNISVFKKFTVNYRQF
jgi:hypothetical protein